MAAAIKGRAYLLPLAEVNRADRLVEQIKAITDLVATASEVAHAVDPGLISPAKDDSIPCALWAVAEMADELRAIANIRAGDVSGEKGNGDER